MKLTYFLMVKTFFRLIELHIFQTLSFIGGIVRGVDLSYIDLYILLRVLFGI